MPRIRHWNGFLEWITSRFVFFLSKKKGKAEEEEEKVHGFWPLKGKKIHFSLLKNCSVLRSILIDYHILKSCKIWIKGFFFFSSFFIIISCPALIFYVKWSIRSVRAKKKKKLLPTLQKKMEKWKGHQANEKTKIWAKMFCFLLV